MNEQVAHLRHALYRWHGKRLGRSSRTGRDRNWASRLSRGLAAKTWKRIIMGLSSVLVQSTRCALWSTGGGSTLDPMVVKDSPIVFAATRVKLKSGFFNNTLK